MTDTKDRNPIEKIHNIHPGFNRFFDKPLFIAAAFITLIVFISPYWARIVLAFLINLFFNRPKVYLNWLALRIASPLQWMMFVLFYLTFFGVYAIIYKVFRRILRQEYGQPQWVDIKPSDQDAYWYSA